MLVLLIFLVVVVVVGCWWIGGGLVVGANVAFLVVGASNAASVSVAVTVATLGH